MRKYEMFVSEDTLAGFDFEAHPSFTNCFKEQAEYSPYVILLKEIIDNYEIRTVGT